MKIKKLSPDETAYFCEQLSLMLNAGMNLADGMDILSEDIGDEKIKAVCRSLSEGLTQGSTLDEAMSESGVFPEYAVKMARLGAVSGRIEDVLSGLCSYYESRAELTRTVRTAVLHPLMLLVMMTVVIIVLIVLVIPMFGEIFSQFDSSVSETAQNTVNLAYGMGVGILIVLLAVIAAAVVTAVLSGIPNARRALSRFAAVFPLTRGVSRRLSLAKVSKAMSIMISSGISVEEALQTAAGLTDDKALSDRLTDCRKRVLDGEYFADVISDAGIFPAIYARSLKIAYNSGSFEKTWQKISDRTEESASQSVAGILSFVEPAIIIILTLIIGAILLTVMIPLMNIMSVLG